MGKEAKNGFLLSWPNMALSQKNLDKSILSLILRDQKRKEEEKRKREKKRKRKRRRREEKKRREEERKVKKMYGFYDFWYGYYMESKDFMVLYGILGNFMSSKPRV